MPPRDVRVVETNYELTCGFCGAKIVNFKYPGGAGLRVGSTIPYDRTDSVIGRCFKCKRYKMMVTKVPDPPPPEKPKGFSKVPVS